MPNPNLTPAEAEWLRLAEEATPGPWTVELGVTGEPVSERTTRCDEVLGGADGEDEILDIGCHGTASDLTFTAAARTAVPALCAALAEARGLLLRVHHRIAGTAGTDAPCTAADVEEIAAHLTAAGLIEETKDA